MLSFSMYFHTSQGIVLVDETFHTTAEMAEKNIAGASKQLWDQMSELNGTLSISHGPYLNIDSDIELTLNVNIPNVIQEQRTTRVPMLSLVAFSFDFNDSAEVQDAWEKILECHGKFMAIIKKHR